MGAHALYTYLYSEYLMPLLPMPQVMSYFKQVNYVQDISISHEDF